MNLLVSVGGFGIRMTQMDELQTGKSAFHDLSKRTDFYSLLKGIVKTLLKHDANRISKIIRTGIIFLKNTVAVAIGRMYEGIHLTSYSHRLNPVNQLRTFGKQRKKNREITRYKLKLVRAIFAAINMLYDPSEPVRRTRLIWSSQLDFCLFNSLIEQKHS
ncbi:hypothetical protein BD560DRAFT_492706 [Blakeslea trispora]|nr:hypothetical protein BD560DRAFT_492706 [Blakeslea trispora]